MATNLGRERDTAASVMMNVILQAKAVVYALAVCGGTDHSPKCAQ